MYLIGFVMGIYQNARSPECQKSYAFRLLIRVVISDCVFSNSCSWGVKRKTF